MGGDNNTEKRFSEYVDRLVKGEDAPVKGEDSDELKETMDFSKRLMSLGSEPLPAFRTSLLQKLMNQLSERERLTAKPKKWWPLDSSKQWMSIAATAVILTLVVVSALEYRNIFPQSPASTSQPAPTIPGNPPATAVPTSPPTQSPRQSAPSLAGPPLKTGGNSEASWAFSFNNLYDLTAFSDDIVIATVDRAVDVTRQNGGYTTRWALKVEKTLNGPQMSQIVVSQLGSPNVPGSDSSEDPLFIPGERYLLFLRESTQYFYFGPNGRYLIWNDKVYSMNNIIVSGGGYQAPTGLNFAGQDLNSIVSKVTALADSVQMIFTQGEPRLQADVLRYPAGTTLDIDVRLSSGEHGPAKVTMSVDTSKMPTGLKVGLQPAEFVAYPRSANKSTLTITMDAGLLPGTYQIPVKYDFDGVGQGSRVITLHVESY